MPPSTSGTPAATPATATPVDRAIQAYLRASAAAGRDTQRVGPFLATFDRGGNHPFLNYAIPDDGAEPSPDEVEALADAYEARDRTPRLEYLPVVAPAVEAALLAAAFTVELRPPLMACPPDQAVDLPAPPGIDLLVPVTDDDLFELVGAQMSAFGEPPADRADVDRVRGGLDRGGLAVLARDARTGTPAGGGVCTPIRDATTEVAGIGVVAAYRRRGIAAAVTAWLTCAALDAGATAVFLTPGDDGAGRVYARAGFRVAGEMLHVSR